MSFEGKAVWAQGVGAGVYAAVWEEGSVAGFAYGAGDGVAAVEEPYDADAEAADALEVFTGDEADEECDYFFHKRRQR